MQIVIDIPKEQYSLIMQSYRSGVARFIDKEAMMYAIKNGIPLDKIRAEIEQITDTMGVRYNQYVSKIDVLQIIDKYRGDADEMS